jgi:hypothetical protein
VQPAPTPDCPTLGIDAHTFHQGQVDHQPIVDAAESRSVVATAPNCDGELAITAETHAGDNVGGVDAARDDPWPLVDHGIVELACLAIVGIIRLDERAAQTTPELRNRCLVEHRFLHE